MGVFVTGNTPLPPLKVDANPPVNPTQEVDAADLNNLWAAAGDLRTRIREAMNVKDYGAVGGGVSDDTVAINMAIAAASAGTIYLPAGKYLYNGTQATYVDTEGPGRVVDGGGNPRPYFVKRMGTSALTSQLLSYIGFLNRDYTGDNGTRLYLLPRAAITTGAGGVLKIFADPYHLGSDYRDFGIYFSADQGGDTGHYANGVWWLNAKNGPLSTSTYGKNNPDIGFSFNDGEVIAGRIVRMDAGLGGDRAHWYFGSGPPSLTTATGVIAEFQKNIAFGLNGHGISFMSASGSANTAIQTDATGSRVEFTWQAVRQGYFSTNGFALDHRIVLGQTSVTTNTTTIDVTQSNSVVVGNTGLTTVTGLVGYAAGQTVRLIFSNGNTTLQNGATFHLAGAVNFTPAANTVVTFICTGSAVYEAGRSVN